MGAGGGAGAGQMFGMVLGAAQYLGAKQKEGNLKNESHKLEMSRPKIGRDVLADSNLTFLKSELANGMSAEAEQAYTDQSDKQFSASLGTILRGGGDMNTIGDIYGNSQEGRMKLAMLQDNLRLNQIKNVLDQSEYVDQRNVVTPFQVNQYAPWQEKAKAVGIARAAAAKEANDALNSIAGGAGSMSAGGGLGDMGGGSGGGANNADLAAGAYGGSSFGGGLGTMSDKRLKHNYHVVGKSPSGINIYQFSYLGSNNRYEGVMADEVLHAAIMTDSGYMAVDYNKIDVQFKRIF